MKKSGLFAILVVVAFIVGYGIATQYPLKRHSEPIMERVDTLIVNDTIKVTEPLFVERHRLDSVLVPVTDTLRLHDTLFVYLEREQVEWRDSLCEVYASGISPQIDSVRHFTQYKVITIEKSIPVRVKTRWGLGVSAGYGVGKEGLSPYVGIGVSYNLLAW